jgi:hypothetical protein
MRFINGALAEDEDVPRVGDIVTELGQQSYRVLENGIEMIPFPHIVDGLDL